MDSCKRQRQQTDQTEGSHKRPRFDFSGPRRLLSLSRGTSGLGSSSSTILHGSFHMNGHSKDASYISQSAQPPSHIEKDLSGATQPHPAEAATGSQPIGTNAPMPPNSSQHRTIERSPRQPAGAPSSRNGMQFATSPIGGAVGACSILPLQDISDMLQGFAGKYIIEEKAKSEQKALQQRLETLLRKVDEQSSGVSPQVMISRVKDLCDFIERKLSSLAGNQAWGQPGGPCLAKEDEDRFMVCYDLVQEYMEPLLLDTTICTREIGEQKSEDRMTFLIGRIPPSLSAWYDSGAGKELNRRECTPGTRIQVLTNLLGWVGNESKGGVYWLNGMAGTGKTTIAYSVCKQLAAKRSLGASFFCSRSREECRDVNLIIPSIAYQLAKFSPPFRLALSAVLEKDPDIYGKGLYTQFKGLVQEPLLTAELLPTEGFVVVIDALDECDNKESTRDILALLLNKAADLPIRFIVSSRPEPQIRDELTDERVKSRLVLHELDKGEVQADIKKYLREGLAPMNPSDEQIAALAEKAGMLFIYAATAVRYIGYDRFESDPKDRLDDVLDGPQLSEGGNDEIDELYTTILKAALGNRRLRNAQRVLMQQVLYTVVCARQPLTVEGLSRLLGAKDTERVRKALGPLWSVLHVMEGSKFVTTLHASFPDFMFDLTRSKAYWCDPNVHHRKLAEHCFEYIAQAQPQFNICGLDSSYVPDEDVPNIQKRVVDCISSEMLYACRFWADHVKAAERASSLVERVRDFLSTRLLLWMEVLNLTNQMKAGVECVKLVAEWSKTFEGEQELEDLAHDAKRFVEMFALNPVSQSTPHIYVSMLAFWPTSAPIAKHYAKYTRGPVEAAGTALGRRQPAHLSTWAFENRIEAMAVSPDGLHVGLGMGKDVHVVDRSSGRVVLGPLKGHPKQVKSVTFAPDGSYIVAGSFAESNDYATMIGWDTRAGDVVLGPLWLEHTCPVHYLSFSPGRYLVATGPFDKIICLRDPQTGLTLLRLQSQDSIRAAVSSSNGPQVTTGDEPGQPVFCWETGTGRSTHIPQTLTHDTSTRLACSPDQSCIASGPGNFIHIWNSLSGKMFRSIEGYADNITCIGYSPDGKLIVSGSDDRTVRVWDAQTGDIVLGPLEGHINTVTAVAFTPDSSRIISACKGGLVCTWDARQRTLTSYTPPPDPITCVKFSSDGTHFVTGSTEGTICMWVSHTGEIVLGPVKVHSSRINAVDFKNNHVASGSRDGKICVCDARSGEVVLGPLQVNSWGGIRSIAYSPDGKLIATGSSAGVDVWNAQDGSRVLGPLTDHHGDVLSIRYSPDGTRIVAGFREFSSNIRVWDVSSGRIVFGTLDGHRNWVFSVSYSPNGALIASASWDKTIIIWDAYTGSKKAISPLIGHSDWVCSVSFSSDSTRLVSCSLDKTIRIWDVQTGEMVFNLLHGRQRPIRSVEYSPDGTRILFYSQGSVWIYDARSPAEMARSCPKDEVRDWTMNKGGWVVDDQSRQLVWVPGDLQKSLMWPKALQTKAHSRGHLWLKFDKSRMGELWARSYGFNV